jgi:hypothetical protein
MLGTFTSLYKFLINALPILIPALNPSSKHKTSLELPTHAPAPSEKAAGELNPEDRRRQRLLSLTANAQLALIRKRVRRWHAALAGAVAGGLAIMCENRSRRGIISQQMFVR